jgi:prevent-host-death family protein
LGGKAKAMIRIGENDFLRAFDAMSEMARKDPVTITKQGQDRLVVMSAEEYERLMRGDAQACDASTPAGRRELEAASPAQPAH